VLGNGRAKPSLFDKHLRPRTRRSPPPKETTGHLGKRWAGLESALPLLATPSSPEGVQVRRECSELTQR
jgi:hypothetical protein